MNIRTVFMGSPEFALPALRLLAADSLLAMRYSLVGVVTQPDRPAGRGRQLTPPPVKSLALELDLPVIQPARLREPAAIQQLRQWAPELIIVAAFGQILRPEVLELPRYGCLNVHASLLPRWRGAAPIPAAILQGDSHSGVTIMLMDPGLDTGPLLSQRATPIQPGENAGQLSERLAQLGAELLLESLPPYLSGELQAQPQEQQGVTYAAMLKKEDGRLDFHQAALELERCVRAFNPWPGAFMDWQGAPLKIQRASLGAAPAGMLPGKRLVQDGLPAVVTSQGALVLNKVQPAGKRCMTGADFLRGARNWPA
jgi:methionyl-tRNA formyltransferase